MPLCNAPCLSVQKFIEGSLQLTCCLAMWKLTWSIQYKNLGKGPTFYSHLWHLNMYKSTIIFALTVFAVSSKSLDRCKYFRINTLYQFSNCQLELKLVQESYYSHSYFLWFCSNWRMFSRFPIRGVWRHW